MVFPTERSLPPDIQKSLTDKARFTDLLDNKLKAFQARVISATFLLDELTRESYEADAMLFSDVEGGFTQSLLIARRVLVADGSRPEIQIHAPFSSPPEIQDHQGLALTGQSYPSVTLGIKSGRLSPLDLKIHDSEHGKFVIAKWNTPRIELARSLVRRFSQSAVITSS